MTCLHYRTVRTSKHRYGINQLYITDNEAGIIVMLCGIGVNLTGIDRS